MFEGSSASRRSPCCRRTVPCDRRKSEGVCCRSEGRMARRFDRARRRVDRGRRRRVGVLTRLRFAHGPTHEARDRDDGDVGRAHHRMYRERRSDRSHTRRRVGVAVLAVRRIPDDVTELVARSEQVDDLRTLVQLRRRPVPDAPDGAVHARGRPPSARGALPRADRCRSATRTSGPRSIPGRVCSNSRSMTQSPP